MSLSRPAGAVISLLVTLAVLLVLLTIWAVRERQALDSQRYWQRRQLDFIGRNLAGRCVPSQTARFVQRILGVSSKGDNFFYIVASSSGSESTETDTWGRPLLLFCPGPLHKNGWDLISCGPNGIYEEGEGDDIVVGEDLPGGLSSIDSSATAAVTSESK